MIHTMCPTCRQSYRLMLSSREHELLQQIASSDGTECDCPRLCGGKIPLVGPTKVDEAVPPRDPITLSGAELYRAVNGMGMADEIPKNRETVEALIKANRASGVIVEEAGGRFYLHELHLENGLVVHLAAGLRGAEVLKITREVGHGR